MRKEIAYSLVALGAVTPVAVNAEVGSGVTLDPTKWSGTSYSVNNGVITVSDGSAVTCAAGTLLPGKYQVKIGTIQGQGGALPSTQKLTVKVLSGETVLGTGEIQTNNQVVEFTLEENTAVSVSVESTGYFEIGNISLDIDFPFVQTASDLNDTLNKIKQVLVGQNGYKTNLTNHYDTKLAELTSQVEAISQMRTIAVADGGKDNVYNDVYEKYELYKDLTETAIYNSMDSLRTVAYEKELADLNAKIAKLEERLADPSLPDNLKGEDVTDALQAAKDAAAAFKAGDSSKDAQDALTAATAKVDNAEAVNDVLEAYYTTTVQQLIQQVRDNYTALEAWKEEALVAGTSYVEDNVDDLSYLKGVMTDTINVSKSNFNAVVENIQQAYLAGTLLKTKKDNNNNLVIDNTAGSWFTGFQAALTDSIAKLAVNENPTAGGAYQKAYNTYKTNFLGDNMLGAFKAAKQDYDKAVRIGNNSIPSPETPGDATARQAAKTAMDNAYTALKTMFVQLAKGKATTKNADNTYADTLTIENIYKADGGALLKTVVKIKDLYDALGIVGNNPTADPTTATGKIKDYLAKLDQTKLAFNKQKEDVKATFDDLLDDIEGFKAAVKYAAAQEANAAWAQNGYDAEAVWTAGNDSLTYNYFKSTAEAAKTAIDAITSDKASDLNQYKNDGVAGAEANGAKSPNKILTEQIQAVITWVGDANGITSVTTEGKLIANAYTKFKELKDKYEGETGWGAKMAAVDDLFANSDYQKAKNDPSLIAGLKVGEEDKKYTVSGFYGNAQFTYPMSYQDRLDSLHLAVDSVANALTAAPNKHGFDFFKNVNIVLTSLDTPHKNFVSLGKVDDTFTGILGDHPEDILGAPLIDNATYDAMVSDAAFTKLVQSVNEKLERIKDGATGIKNDANGANAENKFKGYGSAAKANEIYARADSLIKTEHKLANNTTVVQHSDLDKVDLENPYGILTNDGYQAVIDAAKNQPDHADLHTYSDYLDEVEAELKKLKSDTAGIKAAVAETNEFFTTKKEGVTVSGAEISPEDISKVTKNDIAANPLYQYFLTKVNAIRRNDGTNDTWLKYPVFKVSTTTGDQTLLDAYEGNEDDICINPLPTGDNPVVTGLIADLGKAILDAKADASLQEKWADFVAKKEMIIGRIDSLVVFADDAQAAYKAKEDLIGAAGKVNIEGLTAKTGGGAYTNEYVIAENKLKTLLGDELTGNPATAFKNSLAALYDSIWTNGLVSKVEAAYAKVVAKFAATDFKTKGYVSIPSFSTTEFYAKIQEVLDALDQLPKDAKENEDAKTALKEYLGSALVDGANVTKNIETEYLRIKAKIEANDATNAGADFIADLEGWYAEFDRIRTDSTGTAAWDKVKANYEGAINPANLTALAAKLAELYKNIEDTEKAQEEGYIAAVAADNADLKEQLEDLVADAKEKYAEAVETQDEAKGATQQVLKDAVAAANLDAPQFNANLYQYPAKIEKFENDVLAADTGKFDKWCNANVGKVYPDEKFDEDTIAIKGLTKQISDLETGFRDALTAKVEKSVGAAEGWLKKPSAITGLITKAKTFKNYGLSKAKPSDIENYFKTEKTKYDNVEKETPAKAGDKFSLAKLDEAIRVNMPDTAVFVKQIYADLNNVAHADLDNVIAEAATIYTAGNAAFLGTENEEAWLVSAKKYEQLDSLWDDAVSRENTTEFEKQVGKKYDDIKDKYDKFITNNLQIQTTGAQGAVNMAKADTTVLYKALKDSVALYAGTSYGADGAMQKLVDGIKQDIDTLVSKYENKGLAATIASVQTDSTNIHKRINQLYAYKLADAEYAFVEDQIKALKEQYNRMKADGKDSLAAVLKTAIDSIADVIADNKKSIAEELKNNKFDAAQRAKNVSSLAVLKAAEDKIAELLKAAAEENGIDTAAVKAELNEAINDALANAQEAKENLGESLTDEQKALAEAKIQEAIDELNELKDAVEESENIVADKNKIEDLIEAAENKVTLATEQAEKEQGSNAAADEANTQAAQELLEDGFTYLKGTGNAAQEITVLSVAELREAFEDTAEKLADEDVFEHITPELTAGRMQAIEDAIDELQEEIEDALEAGEAVDYRDAKYDDGENVFDSKGKAVLDELKRVLDFAAQKEAQAYAEDLNDQFDGIYADLGYKAGVGNDPGTFTNPGIYTAADFNNLKTAAGKIRQSFVDAKIEEDAETVEYEQVKNGNTITNIGLEALLKKADKIQTRIDSLQERMAALAMGEVEEVIGDVDGDGVVTDDDVDAFLAALAAGTYPAKNEAAFDIYDVNGDGKINIADAQGILNLSIGLNVDGTDPDDIAAAARKSESLTGNITAETTQLENGAQRIVLTLDANFEYTGFQLDVQGAEVLSEKSQNMTLKTGDMKNGAHRILGFNFGMPQGNGQVIAIDVQGNAQLGTITFTTADAQAVSFKLSGTTGIYGITTESSNVFYDLSGKLVKGMKKGVNIIRDAAGKAKKAIMK